MEGRKNTRSILLFTYSIGLLFNALIMHRHTRMMIIIIYYHIDNVQSYRLNIDLAVGARMGHMAPSGRSG